MHSPGSRHIFCCVNPVSFALLFNFIDVVCSYPFSIHVHAVYNAVCIQHAYSLINNKCKKLFSLKHGVRASLITLIKKQI